MSMTLVSSVATVHSKVRIGGWVISSSIVGGHGRP